MIMDEIKWSKQIKKISDNQRLGFPKAKLHHNLTQIIKPNYPSTMNALIWRRPILMYLSPSLEAN